MSGRRAAIAGGALALALAAPLRAAAHEPPLVKAVALAEQEMRDDGDHAEYGFPITLAEGVRAADLGAYTARVSLGARVDPGLLRAFMAEMRVSPDAGPALWMRVDFDVVTDPGIYEVEIAVVGTALGGDAQRVTVKLTHPAAQLRPHPTVLVNGSWPLLLGLGRAPREIVLGEASRRSRLTRITIEQQGAPLSEGHPVDGRLVFTPPEWIAPGSSAAVPIAIEGSFPVGTTRGRVEVQAAQLERAVTIDYELRVRVTSLAIPLVFLAGTGIGKVARGRLKKRADRLERDLRARDPRARPELDEAWRDVERQLLSARAARTAIAAVIMAVLTWALHEHDFVGTARELVSLFLLGFTTNVSADALFAALERARKV